MSPSTEPQGHAATQIAHVVIIEMENRSFDSYFGTFPGVNGIPKDARCNPDPQTSKCILPFHDASLENYGGPHDVDAMRVDLDGGKLNGFIRAAEEQPKTVDPYPDEVMGYHTCAEIPVYCAYASEYTLADDHFAVGMRLGNRLVHPVQAPYKCRLPAPRAPEQRQSLAGGDVERHVAQRRPLGVAVGEGHVFEAYG